MVICLERCADLHMAQLMPLPLTVSCSNKIQIGFTFLVPAHPGSPGQRAVKRVYYRQVIFDWRYVSLVMDRFLMYVYMIVTVVATCSILIQTSVFVSFDQETFRAQVRHRRIGLSAAIGVQNAKKHRHLKKLYLICSMLIVVDFR